ncbi:MAG: serralysin [Candidatus Micrarchaeota archaeon]|nr:MAG: serralysin [Candidatus Micrarchaeota archaeon]
MESELNEWMHKRLELVNKALKENLDRFLSTDYLKSKAKFDYDYNKEAIDKAIKEPAEYLISLGGKRLRCLLTIFSMEAFGVDSNRYIEFSIVPEVIHTATLIHDDIEDNSEKRRGAYAVHIKYGLPIALNLGDVMLFLPFFAILDSKKLDKDKKYKILDICLTEMVKLGIGQGMDIVWHNEVNTSISESEYIRMVVDKTGALTSIAMGIGGVIAGLSDSEISKLQDIGRYLGIIFQIQDDILNIQKSNVSNNKGILGEDISEGKITLILLRALSKLDKKEAERLKDILKIHTKDRALIDEALSYIYKTDAIDYAKSIQKSYLDKALALTDELIKDSYYNSIMKQLLYYSANRES